MMDGESSCRDSFPTDLGNTEELERLNAMVMGDLGTSMDVPSMQVAKAPEGVNRCWFLSAWQQTDGTTEGCFLVWVVVESHKKQR